jgi:hypothetical protein
MHENIWIWHQDNRILKAVIDKDNGILRIYDENNRLILKRTGLNEKQIKEVETCIIKYYAKRLDDNKKPFKFL